ncbi:MAG: arylsulfatase [Armatimonadetes bacterium]|nr:arylsulfatase [Armatimonadota bacterium]
MADDLGYGELGCYGQSKIPTPHLDGLARSGVRLTRFYAASTVCAPTRTSLLTGMHQGHAAIRGNREQGGFGPNDPEGQEPLPASETTVAEVFKKAGYRTALVGKWGLGGTSAGQSPLDHGFDRFYGFLCQRRAHNHYPAYLWSDRQPDLLGNPVFDVHQRISVPLADEGEYRRRYTGPVFAGEKLAAACLDFIDTSAGRPFFLYYAPTLPHAALQAPAEWVDRFPKEWDTAAYLGDQGYAPCARPRATYAAMIAFLDDTVGRIIDKLKAKGLERETLVIFTSDNGATFNGGVDREFFRSNGSLRSGKTTLYEGGIRVPFLASWPGRIPSGRTSGRIAAAYDSLVSLADAAGLKAPRCDGSSYWPDLTGRESRPHRSLYFEYPESTSMQAAVWGRFKAVRPNIRSKPQRIEVYDLEADPGESHDLAQDRPDLVERAVALFAKEHRPNAVFPLPGVDVVPVKDR